MWRLLLLRVWLELMVCILCSRFFMSVMCCSVVIVFLGWSWLLSCWSTSMRISMWLEFGLVWRVIFVVVLVIRTSSRLFWLLASEGVEMIDIMNLFVGGIVGMF